nr:hypothetical protein [Thiomicrorhabdus sp.]
TADAALDTRFVADSIRLDVDSIRLDTEIDDRMTADAALDTRFVADSIRLDVDSIRLDTEIDDRMTADAALDTRFVADSIRLDVDSIRLDTEIDDRITADAALDTRFVADSIRLDVDSIRLDTEIDDRMTADAALDTRFVADSIRLDVDSIRLDNVTARFEADSIRLNDSIADHRDALTALNDSISDHRIDIDAINVLADGKIYIGDGSNIAKEYAISGDVTMTNAGVTAVQDGAVIVSNLEALADAEFVIGTNGTTAGNAKATMSGDVTMTNAGVTTIGATKVTNAMLAGSIDLTAKVTGTLPVANGGTGVTTFGDANTILYTTATNTLSSIATANDGVLVTNGTGVPSISSTIAYSNLPPGTMILLYAEEPRSNGIATTADIKTYALAANTFSRIIVEAEIAISQSGTENVDWDFEIEFGAVSKTVIPLRARGNNTNDNHEIFGVIKHSDPQTTAVTISINVSATVEVGTWYVDGFRVYGVI